MSTAEFPVVELNGLADEILIKIFVYLDFKTRHNRIPLVCVRWSNLVRSNELWKDVYVSPQEESPLCNGPISQAKVFHWSSRSHIRPHIRSLALIHLGTELDDFTPVGLGALFGICCSVMKKLEMSATRMLLSDLSSLLCLFHIEDLSLTCIDPDPLNPFQEGELQCIAGLTKLSTLVFDLNLVLIPRHLSQLQHLKKLTVSGTGNTSLFAPFELTSLKHLNELIVKSPLWAEVPEVVANLQELTSFEIREHPYFPHDLKFGPAAAKMHRLERLGIVAHRLQKTPEEVGDMSSLKRLDLSLNSFDERLPSDVTFPFRRLARLESVDISRCQLTQLPYALRHLTSLTELNLSGNRLERMSNVLSKCLHLKRLLMNGCGLQSIPVEIADVPNLEHLDVSNNPITSSDGLSVLLKKEKFVSLVFRQERWTPDLVSSACRMARIWGKHEPVVV